MPWATIFSMPANEIRPERLTLLRVSDALLAGLYPLLERGVGFMGANGASLHDFLTGELGLDPAFLQQNVQTVFCDSHPIDDLAACPIHEGAIVALSAAMPGLVGAVMRRDGPLQGLREGISSSDESAWQSGDNGPQVLVWLKIFNTLRAPLAPVLLRRGVLLRMQQMDALLRELPEHFWQQSGGVLIKGRRFNPLTHELGLPQTDALVELEVRAPTPEKENE